MHTTMFYSFLYIGYMYFECSSFIIHDVKINKVRCVAHYTLLT